MSKEWEVGSGEWEVKDDMQREAAATVKKRPTVHYPLSTLPTNPFSSRKVIPGAIPFLFTNENESDFRTIIRRFEQTGCFAQIVGPHGTGKSTFLHEFLSRISEQGKTIHAITLRDKQRKLPQEFKQSLLHSDRDTIAVVDGYEQLALPDRFFLRFLRFRRRCGVLLTAHRRVLGVPVLWKTKPDFRTILRVAEFLLHDYKRFEVSHEELRNLFQEHGGNLRMVLLSLYDRFEEIEKIPCCSTVPRNKRDVF